MAPELQVFLSPHAAACFCQVGVSATLLCLMMSNQQGKAHTHMHTLTLDQSLERWLVKKVSVHLKKLLARKPGK